MASQSAPKDKNTQPNFQWTPEIIDHFIISLKHDKNITTRGVLTRVEKQPGLVEMGPYFGQLKCLSFFITPAKLFLVFLKRDRYLTNTTIMFKIRKKTTVMY